MKKSQLQAVSYAQYLKRWENSLNSKETIRYPAFITHPTGEDPFGIIPSIVYLWDIQRMKYLYFSKNVLEYTGYSAEEFTAKGPYFTYSLVHPDDIPEVVEKVQKTQLEFMHSLPAGDYTQYRFSYSYRLRRADGAYIHILTQENFLQADTKGNPLLSFGIVSDITHLKKDNTISLSISKLNKNDGFMHNLYAFGAREGLLSGREIQILKLIIEGCSTEEIAGKLCISSNTVKNHRRHMLEKTSVKNTPELIRYAVKSGLV